jgi:hypothetical protein
MEIIDTGKILGRRLQDEKNILHKIKRRVTGLVTSCVETAFQTTLLKGRQKEG